MMSRGMSCNLEGPHFELRFFQELTSDLKQATLSLPRRSVCNREEYWPTLQGCCKGDKIACVKCFKHLKRNIRKF